MTRLSAQNIWDKDKRKRDAAISRGFTIITIWENEWKTKETEILLKIKEIINEKNHTKNKPVV